jgi:hypothetical protein
MLLKIQVFWDVTLCSCVFALKMEALLSLETIVNTGPGTGWPQTGNIFLKSALFGVL